eukprot:60405-Ditylum_brightwellii.AAC.1
MADHIAKISSLERPLPFLQGKGNDISSGVVAKDIDKHGHTCSSKSKINRFDGSVQSTGGTEA